MLLAEGTATAEAQEAPVCGVEAMGWREQTGGSGGHGGGDGIVSGRT